MSKKGKRRREQAAHPSDGVGQEGVAILRLPWIGRGVLDTYWFLLNQDRPAGTARVRMPQLEATREAAHRFAEQLPETWRALAATLDTELVLLLEERVNELRAGLPRIEYALVAPRDFLAIALGCWLDEGAKGRLPFKAVFETVIFNESVHDTLGPAHVPGDIHVVREQMAAALALALQALEPTLPLLQVQLRQSREPAGQEKTVLPAWACEAWRLLQKTAEEKGPRMRVRLGEGCTIAEAGIPGMWVNSANLREEEFDVSDEVVLLTDIALKKFGFDKLVIFFVDEARDLEESITVCGESGPGRALALFVFADGSYPGVQIIEEA